MKITKILILVILTSVVNLVYTQQQCESEICTQLSQLCNTNVHNPSITSGIPGKRGPKGEKGDSSTFIENEENNRRFATKLASLHQQLASLQNENQRLKADLDESKEMCNNKILSVLSRDENFRLKACGLLQRPSNIEDSQFSTSSYWDNNQYENAAPHNGRLFNQRDPGWHTDRDLENQWILVDLAKNENIYGVATQGRVPGNKYNQWVTSYSISYKTNIDENFRNIENESGTTVVFQGNSDRNTPVVNDFPQPITARYFRINVLTYHSHIVLRFDLLTC